jgi:hypothetical protein
MTAGGISESEAVETELPVVHRLVDAGFLVP